MKAELTTYVDIDAPAERVWEVLTDLSAYAEWNPFITRAEGEIVEGARIWVSLTPVNSFVPSTLRPTVLDVVPYRRVRLRSPLARLGIPGLFHVERTMTITDHDGGVRLWLQDRFGGLLTPVLTRSLNRHRLAAFNAMNAAVKERAEAMQAGPGG